MRFTDCYLSQGGVTRFLSHDIMGNVLTREDARGKRWQYAYDAAGRLAAVTDPLDRTIRLFYDKKGNKVRQVDPQNRETLFEYDQHNRLIKQTDPLGQVTRFGYNPDGKLTSRTDAEGKAVRYEYDADGRLVKSIDGNGNETVMDYDASFGTGCSACSGGAKDQPARIVYPSFEKFFSYDMRGRKVLETDVVDGESQVTFFSYDAAGNLVARTDKENRVTGYAYDELKRLVSETDALGGETLYVFDNRDNLLLLTDAENRTTRFAYDRNNRMTGEIRPGGQQTSYAYDDAGNLTEKIDAKNQKTEYGYDDAGRLTEIRYYLSAGDSAAVKSVTFSHDGAGNLTGYDDGTTSAVYVYDDIYRKTGETTDYGPFALENRYSYYGNGLKKTFIGPDGVTYSYSYDAASQITGVYIPDVGHITYSSYTWNRPDEVILPGGSRRTYEYDPLMRVRSITAKDPGWNEVMGYQYSYDKMDNITAKTTEHGPYDYGYDDIYRLTTAENPVQSDEAYSYDGVGNRLTSAAHSDWAYNTNNELQGYDGAVFQYDANGNTIEKNDNGQITKFFYNIEDRLVRVENGAGSVVAAYHYDPFGRRLWKEVDGTRTYFVYSDEGLIGEYDSGGLEIRSYGYKPGSTWTTDPLFMKSGGQYYFYQNDHLGTPQKMTAVNGAVVWSAKYSAFGDAAVDLSASITNNLWFAGQYFDEETGIHYNYHRYYDHKLGRYLRKDPIGLGGGINHYTYVFNSPVKLLDPWGLLDMISAYHQLFHGWRPSLFLPGQPLPGYNYCGPGNNGTPPTSPLDQACKEHDECYETCGLDSKDVKYTCRGQDKGPSCQDDCDDDLCNKARIHGGWIRAGVIFIFCD